MPLTGKRRRAGEVTALVHVCDVFIGPLHRELCECVMSSCGSQWAVDFNRAWITITVPQRESSRKGTERRARTHTHAHVHTSALFL